jgi:hypothetical protein
MTNDNDSNNDINRPTNLVEFESQEVKHKLDNYPDISTDALLVALQKIVEYESAVAFSADRL